MVLINDQLTTFIAVAESKSFNKAASQLFISAPGVIKQINALEKTFMSPSSIEPTAGSH